MTGSTLSLAVLLIGTLGVAASGVERRSEGPFSSQIEKAMATTVTREKTAIEHAIDRDDAREVERLARAGADLEVPLFNRGTAAIIAASGSQWNIVRILLENGADPTAQDRRGTTLSAQAKRSRVRPGTALYQDLEAVREILRREGLY